jgi:hypothetical protein
MPARLCSISSTTCSTSRGIEDRKRELRSEAVYLAALIDECARTVEPRVRASALRLVRTVEPARGDGGSASGKIIEMSRRLRASTNSPNL